MNTELAAVSKTIVKYITNIEDYVLITMLGSQSDICTICGWRDSQNDL